MAVGLTKAEKQKIARRARRVRKDVLERAEGGYSNHEIRMLVYELVDLVGLLASELFDSDVPAKPAKRKAS